MSDLLPYPAEDEDKSQLAEIERMHNLATRSDPQAIRRAALEEAAKVCDALRQEYGPSLSPYTTGARLGADRCARRIRALIEEQKCDCPTYGREVSNDKRT